MASYKSAWLARLLTQRGAEVDVVLTRSALEFVGAVTFEALTGRQVHTALIEPGHALDHIKLARAAALVLVAPATADFLARAATGRSDDLLSACLLATTAPVLLVPAMNDRMWGHGQTVRNVAHLRELGYHVLDPDVGDLAVGEGAGPGRMPEPEVILNHAARVLNIQSSSDLSGKRIVVSAGPTREAIDPVRFISNRSSGKMGVAVATAAWLRGAEVVLVSGPVSTELPVGICVTKVETAEQMRDAIAREIGDADALVMAAAPADFRPSHAQPSKIKKDAGPARIELSPAPDILTETRGARRPGSVIVGFALETDDGLANARKKLEAKDLDMIVLNNAREPGAGFDVDTNRVTLIRRNGQPEELPLLTKTAVADVILDRMSELMRGR